MNKPMECLKVEQCKNCSSFTQPSYYEISERILYYCIIKNDRQYGSTVSPCTELDYKVCPYNKGLEALFDQEAEAIRKEERERIIEALRTLGWNRAADHIKFFRIGKVLSQEEDKEG